MIKLLLIDDDTEVLGINKKYFTNQGYEVRTATGAIAGIRILSEYPADCIVLDVMMPDMNGFAACKKIKTITKAPIIFLTGRALEEDKVKGLLIGADDYIIKPYSLRELSARIQVQVRRTMPAVQGDTVLAYPPLTLNITKHKAYYHTEEIYLSNREYELLYLLASRPNQTITFEEIGNYMWGTYTDSDRRTIMVTASRLRKKLDEYIGLSEYIETVWSKGYKFVAKTREKVV